MIEVTELKTGEEGDWDAFLRGKAGALFVHSATYRDLLVEELNCEPEYLTAREGGEIRGVLPIMWSHEPGGSVCNSLPYFGSPGGPVSADPRAHRALIEAWNERVANPRTLAATMIENPFSDHVSPRPIHGLTDRRIGQFTRLPAGGGESEVLSLISSEARNNVRRAARRGVEIEIDNDAIAKVWEINSENMRALGAPARSRGFLEAITRQLESGEGYDIWIGRIGEEIVAALLVVRFNGVSEYFASGTRAGYRWTNAHPGVVFAALVHETQRRTRTWNWGGTHHGMDGVFHFKRKWGSAVAPYRYLVQVNDRSLLDATPKELLERFPGFYLLPFAALHKQHSRPTVEAS